MKVVEKPGVEEDEKPGVEEGEKPGPQGEEDVEVVWGEGGRHHAPMSQF